MNKEKLMLMQDEYVKQFRKGNPYCDWTDKEIRESAQAGDMVTLQYCFNMTKPQAKRLITEAEKSRRVIIQGAEHSFGE